MESWDSSIIVISLIMTVVVMLTVPAIARAVNKKPFNKSQAKTIVIINGIGAYLLFLLITQQPGSLAPIFVWSWVAYHGILLKGSFFKVSKGVRGTLQGDISRTEQVIRSVWEKHHVDIAKHKTRKMKKFEPSEQMLQRYINWTAKDEAIMDKVSIEEGYYQLAGLHSELDYLAAYRVAQKLARISYKKSGMSSDLAEAKTIDNYWEMLPTEKDFFTQTNILEQYDCLLEKATREFDSRDMKLGSMLLWYYTERDKKEPEKAKAVAKKMLEAEAMHSIEAEHISRLKQFALMKEAFEQDMKIPSVLEDEPNINIQTLKAFVREWEDKTEVTVDVKVLKLGGYILKHAMRFGQIEEAYRVADKLLTLQHITAWGAQTAQSRDAAGIEVRHHNQNQNATSRAVAINLTKETNMRMVQNSQQFTEISTEKSKATQTGMMGIGDGQAVQGAEGSGVHQTGQAETAMAEDGPIVQAGTAAAAAGSQIGGGHANQEQATMPMVDGQFAAAEAAQAPQIKFCRMCGTKLPLDSVFCKQCGTKIIESV